MIRLEEVPCPRCRGGERHTVIRGRDYLHGLPGEFLVAECDRCGMWFQNPRPVAEDFVQLYPDDYRPHAPAAGRELQAIPASRARYLRDELGYGELAATARRSTDWRTFAFWNPIHRWHAGMDLLPRFVPEGRLLEVGCGSGERLRTLREHGWRRLEGIELVPAAAAEARQHGFTVECGPLEELIEQYPDATFDVIVSSMVIEHLPDPFGAVGRMAAKLKPGGQFLFSTICRDAADAAMYGKRWGGLDLPRHLAFFRRADLAAMLAASFERVEYFHQVAPIDFVRAATWRRDDGERHLIDSLVLRAGESRVARLFSSALAWLGRTTRISCRCWRPI